MRKCPAEAQKTQMQSQENTLACVIIIIFKENGVCFVFETALSVVVVASFQFRSPFILYIYICTYFMSLICFKRNNFKQLKYAHQHQPFSP